MSLATVESVVSHLRNTPYACARADAIKSGTTNFVYRLFLEDASKGSSGCNTAVLKYTPPFLASDPDVALPPSRQHHEARVLAHLPWRSFTTAARGPAHGMVGLPAVRLPNLYRHEPQNQVLIIEDCVPPESDSTALNDTVTARDFLEGNSTSKQEVAVLLGHQLGVFLAGLHNWGRKARETTLVESFSNNISAKQLIAQETFNDFFSHVEDDAQCILISQQTKTLTNCHATLKAAFNNQLDTVLAGDFWIGSVLLSFPVGLSFPASISVIDWEYTMLGPVFVDVGWFVGGTLLDFISNGSGVYLSIVENFLSGDSKASSTEADLRRSALFCCIHILVTMPQKVEARLVQINMEEARVVMAELVELATNLAGSGGESQAFGAVLRVMRQHHSHGTCA